MENVWTAPLFPTVAFTIGPLDVRWYALAYIFGLLGGWYYARKLAQRPHLWTPQRPPSMTDIDDLLIYAALGVVIGGRLGQVLFWESGYYFANPAEILKVWKGGMAFHGGLLGSLIAVAIFARARKLNMFALFDLCCTVVPVGLFLGRIANFTNGELWGRVARGVPQFPDFPFAMAFPHAGDGLPRYPSQLYEAFAEGLVLFVVMALGVRLFGFRRPGILGGIFLIGYCIARSVCEIFREPEGGFVLGGNWSILGGGLTVGQALSIPMIIGGIIVILAALSGRTQSREGGTA